MKWVKIVSREKDEEDRERKKRDKKKGEWEERKIKESGVRRMLVYLVI
jgi:hypothetical protein